MNKHYQGGILLSALLFVMLFSFLLSLVVEEAQLTNHFSVKTQEFYSAKIIYSMFCMEISQEPKTLAKSGVIDYSEGKLSYIIKGDYLVTDVLIKQKKYQFKKSICQTGEKWNIKQEDKEVEQQ